MQAAFIRKHGGPEVIEVGELPDPKPGHSQVRVKVKAAALNHLDLWTRAGLPGLNLPFPHVLGGDASGIVDLVGEDVCDMKVGEEVVVHPGLSCGRCPHCLSGWESLCAEYRILGEHLSGTHAEFVVVPRANLFPKPKLLSLEQGAAIALVFTTAWQMVVHRAKVQPGDFVVIHGAGSGVSSAAIQIAKLHGATVLVTSGDKRKLELAAALGADHGIDYKTQDFAKEVKRLKPGGADVIVDHVGQVFWEKNIRALRSGGTLVTCGATSGWQATTDLRHIFYRQIQVLGSTMGSKGDFPKILSQFERGALKPVVSRVFPLKEAREAYAFLEQQGQFGKVILRCT